MATTTFPQRHLRTVYDNRSPRSSADSQHVLAHRVLAIALALYGVYAALHVPLVLAGSGSPILLACMLAQSITAIVAGIGVWAGSALGPIAVLALGASLAATYLLEAFALGIIGWLYAVLGAVLALGIALVVTAYLQES